MKDIRSNEAVYSDQVSDAILDACLAVDPLSKARHPH